MEMKKECEELLEQVEHLHVEDEVKNKASLLSEFHSKKYYDEAKMLLEIVDREVQRIEKEAEENECEEVKKKLKELQENLEFPIEDLKRAIEGHEKYIYMEMEEYGSALNQIVRAIMTGKVEEKEESRGIFSRILKLLEPKPRDVKRVSKKIARSIWKKNMKKIEEITKDVDYDDDDTTREAVEELEKVEFEPNEKSLTKEYLRREYGKILWKSFIPDEKKVKRLIKEIADYRSRVEVIGGDPTKVESQFDVPNLTSFILGEITFEELVEPYYSQYLDNVLEETRKKVEEMRKKFDDEVKKELGELRQYL